MGINYRYETSLLRRHSYNYSYLWQQRSGWPRLSVLISPRLLLEREWLKWLLKAFYYHIYNPEDLFNTPKPFEPLVFKTCISKTSKRPPVPLKPFENDGKNEMKKYFWQYHFAKPFWNCNVNVTFLETWKGAERIVVIIFLMTLTPDQIA